MTEALFDFGTISLATKDVDVYSENELDWGAIDSRATRLASFHRTGTMNDLDVVFVANATFATIDDFIPFIVDGASTAPTTKTITGPQVAAYTGHRVYKGIAWVIPLPKKHKQYMRAGATPKSSGTLTAVTMESYIEFGANIEEATA